MMYDPPDDIRVVLIGPVHPLAVQTALGHTQVDKIEHVSLVERFSIESSGVDFSSSRSYPLKSVRGSLVCHHTDPEI
jgi:hypothetical protein